LRWALSPETRRNSRPLIRLSWEIVVSVSSLLLPLFSNFPPEFGLCLPLPLSSFQFGLLLFDGYDLSEIFEKYVGVRFTSNKGNDLPWERFLFAVSGAITFIAASLMSVIPRSSR
jgi:hypothetical protein